MLPIIIVTFLAVFFLFLALYFGVTSVTASPKYELKRRLQRLARDNDAQGMPEDLRAEIIREIPPLDRILATLPLTRDLDKKLDHAGLDLTASRFLMLAAAVTVVGFIVVVLLFKSFLIALAVAVAISLLPFAYLSFKIRQRLEKFTELFPDALTMISRSLRAGHSFTSAIQLVGEEIQDPVGELFKTAYEQQLLGLRITETLNNLNERVESLDLRFFTTAISINNDVGGNLSDILENLAATIRERLKIRRQVRVYTAQGRMTGYVLGVLPAFTFVVFNILNPKYESLLYKEVEGLYVLSLAVVLQILGFLVIRKIIRIRI
ncbi:type II secretion system F family protein [Geomonas subterranea]|uniref:Type II secretion system F family protein n=1 Tax=Geomonas subterranea TaxID=2847989 RepID=A0ABX8LLC2_9BACT|nr:type II secretion system F family protein [Geomonas subterranea]QXE92299.1 type II secretion system F family protein [Geomonas subterranea]QXM09602.1 type II secretion system F family protein [Geomonas subterranea]